MRQSPGASRCSLKTAKGHLPCRLNLHVHPKLLPSFASPNIDNTAEWHWCQWWKVPGHCTECLRPPEQSRCESVIGLQQLHSVPYPLPQIPGTWHHVRLHPQFWAMHSRGVKARPPTCFSKTSPRLWWPWTQCPLTPGMAHHSPSMEQHWQGPTTRCRSWPSDLEPLVPRGLAYFPLLPTLRQRELHISQHSSWQNSPATLPDMVQTTAIETTLPSGS